MKGLDITGFSGTAIVLTGGSNTIENNYLGTDPTGMSADSNQGGGLDVYGGASNQIVQNVISGNSFKSGTPTYSAAVYVADTGANGNAFAGNYIGVNAAGTGRWQWRAWAFSSPAAQNTLIGANGSGSVSDAAAWNIISANTYGDLHHRDVSGANTTGTIVAGHYIGTDAAGTSAGQHQRRCVRRRRRGEHPHRGQPVGRGPRRRAKRHLGKHLQRCGNRRHFHRPEH